MLKRKRRVRLYVYHNQYQEILIESEHRGLPQLRLPKSFFGLIFDICYYTGLSVMYTLAAPFLAMRYGARTLAKDARHTSHDLAKKVRTITVFRQWRPSMAVFLILVLVGWSTFHSFILAAEAQKVKSRVLGDADLGVQYLAAGGSSLSQNPEEAQKHFREALQNFGRIQDDLESNGVIIDGILKVIPQRADADKLQQSASLISQAGTEAAKVAALMRGVKFGADGITGAGNSGENITAILDAFRSANDKISQALGLLQGVDAGIIPGDKRELFTQVQSQLGNMKETLSVAAQLSDLMESIFLGHKDVLLMFENNNELRPTGGFLGTFGSAALNNGKIDHLHISSIYDLDGQLQDIINPPRPIYAVNARWFLRDSNWFADFPSSAKKMSMFYVKEGGTTPDLVVAITPSVVIDLLNISGPIAMPAYNTTLDSKNFMEMTQLQTSVIYDRALNKPKQFLADFFPVFLQRLSTVQGAQAIAVLSAFQKNLQNKEIMVYSHNSELQQKLQQFHWTGDINATDRDYLSIVSANLGGTKTDTGLIQNATLTSHISGDGEIVNSLSLTRKNPFPNKAPYTNYSFVRILVPPGSTLMSVDGFSDPPPTNSPIAGAKDDPEVSQWQERSVQDLASGTLIGTESGKTYFGNWLIVEGGEEKTVTINYKLPFKIGDTDHHSLLFQKQPGVPEFTLDYRLEFPYRSLEWKNRNPDSASNGNADFRISTGQDQFLGVILGKQ